MSGKIIYKNINEEDKDIYFGDIRKMIEFITHKRQFISFLSDILTLSELIMISRRIQIAKLILTNHSYSQIRSKLGVGFSTITNVDTWLSHSLGEYKKILTNNNEDENIKIIKQNLKNKHQAQYLLLKLLNEERLP